MRHNAKPAPRTVDAVRICLRWVFAAAPRGARNLAIGQLASTFGAVGIVGVSALLFRRLLNSSDLGSVGVLLPLFGFAIFTSATSMIATVSTQRQRFVSEQVERHLWRQILETVAGIDLITYESEGFSTHLARVEQNAVSRPFPTVRAIFAFLGSSLTAIAMGVVLLTFNPLLPIVLLLAAIPSVLLGRAASRSEFLFAKRAVPLYMRRDYLRGILTRREHAAEIHSLGAERVLRPRHDDVADSMLTILRAQVSKRTKLAIASSLVAAVALILVLLAVVVLVDTGHLSLAKAGAAAIAARLFAAALTGAYSGYGSIVEAAPHLLDLEEFFGLSTPQSHRGVRRRLAVQVAASGIGFTYPAAGKPALRQVDLSISAGEVVALVGENGSGKTTLARIVAGLYDPMAGTVHWDGVPSDRHDRIESTSLLTQNFGRYAFSVADNISLGDGGVSDPNSIRVAADRARFAEIAAELPAGYDTVLGRDLDDGVDLSGGQWQRLALARALFRQADLLILDEPSSALDPRAESELFDDVRQVLDGRSVLLISHRFASARLADRIYVLHDGEVVETGTHAELMTMDGRYAELFRLQSSSFLAGMSWQDS